MRMQPLRRLCLVLLPFTVVLAGNATVANAHRAEPAPPTPENFERLRMCESGGDYTLQGQRYSGAYQFSVPTWRSLGYEGMAHEAPPEVQDEAAHRLQTRDGWRPWPACSRRLGLR